MGKIIPKDIEVVVGSYGGVGTTFFLTTIGALKYRPAGALLLWGFISTKMPLLTELELFKSRFYQHAAPNGARRVQGRISSIDISLLA